MPFEVVDESLAAQLVPVALTLSRHAEPVTTKELERWSLHMRCGLTRDNLLNWCSAMVAAGLKPANYADEKRKFTEATASSGLCQLPIM